MKTRIFYATRAQLSFSRAHTKNIQKTVEYLQLRGFEVVLFSSRSILTHALKQRSFYDLFYYRDPGLWYIALLLRLLFRKKIIFEAHGSYEWRWRYPVWRLALATAHGVVYITQALKDFYSLSKPDIVTHCNASDTGEIDALPTLSELRQVLLLPRGKTLVLYAGSFLWDAESVLIDTLSFLPESVDLVLVGIKEEDKPRVTAYARLRGVEARVMCISRVRTQDVSRYLKAADILVNPIIVTHPSSISSKLYEYLAAEKPIVTSPGGANNEVIRHEQNGLIVDTLSAAKFAEAIRRILDDSAFAEKLAKQARKDAAQYTWEVRAEIIAVLIKEVMTE